MRAADGVSMVIVVSKVWIDFADHAFFTVEIVGNTLAAAKYIATDGDTIDLEGNTSVDMGCRILLRTDVHVGIL